ncbi:hypothetical protein C0995_009763, partial [Termitomyces sp. Mi166
MPERRTSSRLKNKKIATVAGATSASSNSSQKPPPKRRKAVASPAPTVEEKADRKIRGTRGKLKLVTEMPLDILYETFSHLQPADLLHLSQASKSLRGILLNRKAQSVWKTSFANIQENPPPKMLPDMTYPNYALLLFGTECQAAPGLYVHWAARLRLCLSCIDERTIPRTDQVGLWYLCPSWIIKLPKGGRRSLCLKEDYERIVQEKDRLKDDKTLLNDFTEAQTRLCRERSEHARQCSLWVQGLKMKRKKDLQTLRSERQKEYAFLSSAGHSMTDHLHSMCKRLREE